MRKHFGLSLASVFFLVLLYFGTAAGCEPASSDLPDFEMDVAEVCKRFEAAPLILTAPESRVEHKLLFRANPELATWSACRSDNSRPQAQFEMRLNIMDYWFDRNHKPYTSGETWLERETTLKAEYVFEKGKWRLTSATWEVQYPNELSAFEEVPAEIRERLNPTNVLK